MLSKFTHKAMKGASCSRYDFNSIYSGLPPSSNPEPMGLRKSPRERIEISKPYFSPSAIWSHTVSRRKGQ